MVNDAYIVQPKFITELQRDFVHQYQIFRIIKPYRECLNYCLHTCCTVSSKVGPTSTHPSTLQEVLYEGVCLVLYDHTRVYTIFPIMYEDIREVQLFIVSIRKPVTLHR